MSVQVAAVARWNWINGFLTASLHASIEYLGLTVSELTFQDFITEYNRSLQRGIQNHQLQHPISVLSDELRYVFHLESELWGSDYSHYTRFFPPDSFGYNNLETFKFVLSFFSIERCLHLFLPSSEKRKGRKGKRRYLFGHQNGLFSVRHVQLLSIMGPPFFLSANRQKVLAVGSSNSAWSSIKKVAIPPSLSEFYRKVSGNRHSHFATILESAFLNTRRTHLVKSLKNKKNQSLPRGTKAWWYDVLWKYSESIRYHPLLPSKQSLSQPFFWNRSVRWFTSLTLTGLLQILAISNPQVERAVKKSWKEMLKSNRVLAELYKDISRF